MMRCTSNHNTSSLQLLLLALTAAFLLCGSVVNADKKKDRKCNIVLANGTDATAQLWVGQQPEDDNGNDITNGNNGYLDCTGHSICRNATITNCPKVKCKGREACFEAKISGIFVHQFHTLQCLENHACHRAVVDMPAEYRYSNNGDGVVPELISKITCAGEGACDVANITALRATVQCIGRKACRKAWIEADTVHCNNGDVQYDACTDYAGLQANCIVCGYRGCDSHVNICRYRLASDVVQQDPTVQVKYEGCAPEKAVGNCTAAWQTQLEKELKCQGKCLGDADEEDW